MSSVIVIGGGPAGMFAAYYAAKAGHQVTLLEKNEKLGKKLYITGKGRCNVTNASDMETIFQNVVSNRKFLYSAFYSCTNEMVMDFFKEQGLTLKVERGNRVFPVSDHSSDVIAALKKALDKVGVQVHYHTTVKELITEEAIPEEVLSVKLDQRKGQQKSKIAGVLISVGRQMLAEKVVVATGGLSYPSTGSTGDGYIFAEKTGHRMVKPTPSLVPLHTKEAWVPELQGLSLKNVSVKIMDGKKVLFEDFGEMLFTHFGVSGPMILSASGSIKPDKFEKKPMLYINLKPALDEEQLDRRILREFEESMNKQFKNSLNKLYPSKMIPVMIELSGIDPEKKVNEISKEERRKLLELTRALPVTITGLGEFKEAIITKGGVSVKDMNPSTMESKLVENLYFCGEVLDLDALTGGYNLQIAWSTGYLAGISC